MFLFQPCDESKSINGDVTFFKCEKPVVAVLVSKADLSAECCKVKANSCVCTVPMSNANT